MESGYSVEVVNKCSTLARDNYSWLHDEWFEATRKVIDRRSRNDKALAEPSEDRD